MIYLQRLNTQGSANKLGNIVWEGLHDAAYMTGNALDKLSQHGPFIKQREKYWKYCIVGVCNKRVRVTHSPILVFRTFPTLTFKQVISAKKTHRTSPLDLASIGLRRLRHERQWPQKSLKAKHVLDGYSLVVSDDLSPISKSFQNSFFTTWSILRDRTKKNCTHMQNFGCFPIMDLEWPRACSSNAGHEALMPLEVFAPKLS